MPRDRGIGGLVTTGRVSVAPGWTWTLVGTVAIENRWGWLLCDHGIGKIVNEAQSRLFGRRRVRVGAMKKPCSNTPRVAPTYQLIRHRHDLRHARRDGDGGVVLFVLDEDEDTVERDELDTVSRGSLTSQGCGGIGGG
jgi:hypothetical protein